MKHEWKKHERDLYGAKDKPQILTVPRQSFIMLKGVGNPNNKDFSERVGVLYSLAYPVKFGFKALYNNNKEERALYEYSDYCVYPLEGVWTTANKDNPLDKNSFKYTIMIRQPDFITKEMFEAALAITAKKKPHPLLSEVVFDTMTGGKSVQILHRGSFDDEPASFANMDSFAKKNGLERLNQYHREIYLNDARKTAPYKRLTILRYQVK
ncbi:MAG TPA: small molecule-binding protein [Ruminococcaceae bacterium]|nr:small molecule-binding protein [Oscillospiraceae bacterium]